MRTTQPAHVFDQPENVHFDPFTKTDRLAHVRQCHFLWCCHDNGLGIFDDLGDGQRLVAGSGWRIDRQKIELSPIDISDKLLNGRILDGTAPDERLRLWSA